MDVARFAAMLFGKARQNEAGGQPVLETPGSNAERAPKRAKDLIQRFQEVRRWTETLCEPLLAEDFGIQPSLEVSPPKWHLAHTTWFFEAMFLRRFIRSYRSYDPLYDFVFNSYYKSAGPHLDRAKRGLLCRPTTYEIRNYRRYVDSAMEEAMDTVSDDSADRLLDILETGIHHEQQHQELLLTDIKAIFWANPLRPTYTLAPDSSREPEPCAINSDEAWVTIPAGIHEIGSDGHGFAYDNERPRHRVWLDDFRIGTKLITNGEYLEFMESGGYRNPMLWLSDGWDLIQALKWEAPLYWERHGSGWQVFTLSGMRKLDPSEPVCHVSFYEADAYARWKGARLPTEAEWELSAAGTQIEGNFAEQRFYHPVHQNRGFQFWGDTWEWTGSAYRPYPGFKPLEGVLGEYNAKFMMNQMVLRGGSCATPLSHIRPSYRNYFEPAARWQFSGFRMAL